MRFSKGSGSFRVVFVGLDARDAVSLLVILDVE